MKSYLIFLTYLLLFLACKSENSKINFDHDPDHYNVAFLIMDGTFNTEFTAPYDVFQHTKYRKGIKGMSLFTIANKSNYITTSEGLRIIPDYNLLTDVLPNIDILVIPSADHHLDSDMVDTSLINFIKNTDKTASYVTSHCDGAFMLAKAGVLEGKVSTTFPGDIPRYKELFPKLDVREDVILVHDGKYITSAGGAKSFDAALYLTHILYGDSITKSLAKGLVIDWDIDKVKKVVVPQ